MNVKTAIVAMACMFATACSNAPESEVTGTRLVRGLINPDKPAPKPTQQQIAAQAAAALANSDAPLILVNIPKRDALAVMQQIETNGAYATYGTSDRRSITLRNGFLTATRGLGNDLMSSEVNAVQALIAGRRAGTATQVKRYLDGEDIIVARTLRCTVSVGSRSRMKVGEVTGDVTAMSERCSGDGLSFTNTYQVTPDGRVLQSKQWISPLNAYIAIQHLRL